MTTQRMSCTLRANASVMLGKAMLTAVSRGADSTPSARIKSPIAGGRERAIAGRPARGHAPLQRRGASLLAHGRGAVLHPIAWWRAGERALSCRNPMRHNGPAIHGQ